jgi:hypothetical protein
MFSEQSLEFLLIRFLPVMSFLICNVTFHRVQIHRANTERPISLLPVEFHSVLIHPSGGISPCWAWSKMTD